VRPLSGDEAMELLKRGIVDGLEKNLVAYIQMFRRNYPAIKECR
jgi:hypothetical protein